MSIEENMQKLQAVGEELQAIEEEHAAITKKRDQFRQKAAVTIVEAFVPELIELHGEARFDRFVQSAMQGLLASGRVSPQAVPPMAVELARHAIALSEEFPESREKSGSSDVN